MLGNKTRRKYIYYFFKVSKLKVLYNKLQIVIYTKRQKYDNISERRNELSKIRYRM